jgi:hypothetical protein
MIIMHSRGIKITKNHKPNIIIYMPTNGDYKSIKMGIQARPQLA